MKPLTLEWIEIAESDWDTARREITIVDDSNFRAVCFHCQQCAEKYLKAFIQELSIEPAYTHDLKVLLDDVVAHDSTFAPLRKSCVSLTTYAVSYRYPGSKPTVEEASQALEDCGFIRNAFRAHFAILDEPAA